MIGDRGRGLIFILSQPRAGSTLLQRMLGAHPDIHTVQEPAIALYPLYGLRSKDHQLEYPLVIAQFFQNAFLETLPGGEEVYVEGLRLMLTHMYEAALKTGTGKYFLDKTPRYYSIIPELYRVFPEAHFILLFRNPLAVLTSILTTWVRGEWLGIANAKSDLVDAPPDLLSGRALLGEGAIEIHFETLVTRPEEVMRRICRHLGVTYLPGMISYGQSELPRWDNADQKSVYLYDQPDPTRADRWASELSHPQIWRLSRDYLNLLGPDTIKSMDYDFRALNSVIAETRPSRPARSLTFSFEWLAQRPPPQRRSWERRLVWLVKRFFLPYPQH